MSGFLVVIMCGNTHGHGVSIASYKYMSRRDTEMIKQVAVLEVQLIGGSH